MKIGKIEKGRFRFIPTDRYSSNVEYGKIYESDEYGVIRLENGTELYTYGDYGNFIEQAEMVLGENDFIEIKDPKYDAVITEMVNSLHYGDFVEFGESGPKIFLGFCRNGAILQDILVEDIISIVPVRWLRKVVRDE